MKKSQLFSRLHKINLAPKSILLLTHTDLDGAGCAVLVRTAFPKAEIDINHCSNAEMSKSILAALKEQARSYDLILATDISLSETDATEAEKLISDNFLLFDHHPTAAHLNQYKWACVYNGAIEDSARAVYYDKDADWHSSATGLLYDYLAFHNLMYITEYGKLVEFAYRVSAYDTWDWKTTNCVKDDIAELNSLCYLYGLSRFEEVISSRIIADKKLIQPVDRILLSLDQGHVDDYLNKLSSHVVTGTVTINGESYSYAGCISTTYIAQTFEYLREQYASYDLFIINTGASVSLRTDKMNIDLGVIAKSLGGGGHRAAAGFALSPSKIQDALTSPFSNDEQTSIFL